MAALELYFFSKQLLLVALTQTAVPLSGYETLESENQRSSLNIVALQNSAQASQMTALIISGNVS